MKVSLRLSITLAQSIFNFNQAITRSFKFFLPVAHAWIYFPSSVVVLMDGIVYSKVYVVDWPREYIALSVPLRASITINNITYLPSYVLQLVTKQLFNVIICDIVLILIIICMRVVLPLKRRGTIIWSFYIHGIFFNSSCIAREK